MATPPAASALSSPSAAWVHASAVRVRVSDPDPASEPCGGALAGPRSTAQSCGVSPASAGAPSGSASPLRRSRYLGARGAYQARARLRHVGGSQEGGMHVPLQVGRMGSRMPALGRVAGQRALAGPCRRRQALAAGRWPCGRTAAGRPPRAWRRRPPRAGTRRPPRPRRPARRPRPHAAPRPCAAPAAAARWARPPARPGPPRRCARPAAGR